MPTFGSSRCSENQYLDIILNLKEIALTGVLESENPCIAFSAIFWSRLKTKKASHIKFPAGIAPVYGESS